MFGFVEERVHEVLAADDHSIRKVANAMLNDL